MGFEELQLYVPKVELGSRCHHPHLQPILVAVLGRALQELVLTWLKPFVSVRKVLTVL